MKKVKWSDSTKMLSALCDIAKQNSTNHLENIGNLAGRFFVADAKNKVRSRARGTKRRRNTKVWTSVSNNASIPPAKWFEYNYNNKTLTVGLHQFDSASDKTWGNRMVNGGEYHLTDAELTYNVAKVMNNEFYVKALR